MDFCWITLLPVILPVHQAQRLDKFLHLTSALKLLITSQVEARPLQGSRVRGLAVNMADYHLSHEMVAGVALLRGDERKWPLGNL